ncbi:MAG: helix-turn-helix domain-containing protein [Rubrobacter sp.]|nr:helix-turn-helix domain-containing protein [Rubrobacter sp.]
MGEDSTAPQSGRRVTVDEAARYLGLSVDAVRKRVQRGQIAHEKDLAGRVRIILDDSETLQDESPDTPGQSAELVGELRDRIRYLERQVEEEREARRRADTILAQLSAANAEQARTIRALEPPAPPESPEPREAGPHRVSPERAEPVEPVDPQREEPERVEPERVEPERVEPREDRL